MSLSRHAALWRIISRKKLFFEERQKLIFLINRYYDAGIMLTVSTLDKITVNVMRYTKPHNAITKRLPKGEC